MTAVVLLSSSVGVGGLGRLGDGPGQQATRSYLRRHDMTDSVTMLGRLDRQEIRGVLGASHVFLAPADLESFGIAALEARCAGLPVIAKARGGVREFVGHGREGLLCGSDADMTDAMVRLVRDQGLRRQIATHNRTTDCSVAWTTVLQKTQEAYESAQLAQPARPTQIAADTPMATVVTRSV